MLAALKPLADEGRAFSALISGIGPTYDETERRIAELGLGGRRSA